MRRLATAIVLATALALPAGAAAKQVTSATICGADGCWTFRDPALLEGLMSGGSPTVPPKASAPVLRVRGAIAERPGGEVMARFTTWWVPSQRLLVAEDGTWMRLAPSAVRTLVKITDGMAPLPASRMRSAVVTGPSPAADAPTKMVPPPEIHRAPPVAAHTDTGGGIDWLLIALPAGTVLAAACGLLLYARRRRPGGGGAPHPAAP
jgi:hypothetical protein